MANLIRGDVAVEIDSAFWRIVERLAKVDPRRADSYRTLLPMHCNKSTEALDRLSGMVERADQTGDDFREARRKAAELRSISRIAQSHPESAARRAAKMFPKENE